MVKKILPILFLCLLCCKVGLASEKGGIREPGTDKKCFYQFKKANVFERKFLPKVKKKKGVFITYVGCNKYYDDWSWDYSLNIEIDVAHKEAYQGCAENEMPEYNLIGCHLFSINDIIVWGKDAAFVAKVEEPIQEYLLKNNKKLKKIIDKKKKIEKRLSEMYVQKYLLWDDVVFTKESPTTFKKLIFNKEKNFSNVIKSTSRGTKHRNKVKNFRSFSFTAEYEDNITLDIFVEYDKDKKKEFDFVKAENEAKLFSNMYGQMPHFLKIHNKSIYIHNDIDANEDSSGNGLWWVEPRSGEFHINAIRDSNRYNRCREKKRYSRCAVVMVHELAHVMEPGTGAIKPSQWLKARRSDKKKYVSEYAKSSSGEDFAESIVSWIVVRHLSNKISKSDLEKFKKFIPNRLKLFDEMNFNVRPL